MKGNPEQVRTLWDSGAYYNLMPLRLARQLKLEIIQAGQLPSLEMANSVLTHPIGRVHVPITWGSHVDYPTEFFVMETCPYDAIMGSHFVKQFKGAIDYDTETVRLTIDRVTVHIPFETKKAKNLLQRSSGIAHFGASHGHQQEDISPKPIRWNGSIDSSTVA